VKDSPFLGGSSEYDRFLSDYHLFPRNLVPNTLAETAASGSARAPGALSLVDTVTTSLRRLAERPDGKGFKCLGIRVHERDGMSWSATAALGAVTAAQAKLRVHALAGEATAEGSLPAIEKLLSRREVAKLAQKHGVTAAFPLVRPLFTAALVLAAVVVGVLTSFLSAVLKSSTPQAPTLQTLLQPSFLLPAVGGTLLAIISNDVSARLKVDPKAITQLAKDIAAKEGTAAYHLFVRDLGAALADYSRPRCTIIDNFDDLDETTRASIDEYFQRHTENARKYELWIIFEGFERKALRRMLAKWKPYVSDNDYRGYRLTQLYDQALLDESERRRLAEYDDTPERANFLAVGDLRHPERFDDAAIKAALSQAWTASGQASLPFRLFYLLALNALGGSPFLGEESVESRLSEARPTRSRVLDRFFAPSSPTLNQVRASLQSLRRDLAPYVESRQVGSRSEFRIRFEVAQTLTRRWHELELPDPKLGHLFWALYWHDRLGGDSVQAFWVRKLTTHILEAEAPVIVDEALPAAVTEAMFDTIIDVASCSLKACLLTDVPKLLERATALVNYGDPATRRSQVRRLRRLAWQAYSALADESLLELIHRLQRSQAAGQARQAAASLKDLDQIDLAFLETMGIWSGKGSSELRTMALAYNQSDAAVKAYGRARVAWLLLTLEPFLVTIPMDLQELASRIHLEVPTILQETLDRLKAGLQAERRGAETLDVMTLSLCLWCVVLVMGNRHRRTPGEPEHEKPVDAEALLQLVEQSVPVAWDVRGTLPASERLEDYDFMLDVLLRDVLISASAAAAMVYPALPAQARSAELDARFHDLIMVASEQHGPSLDEVRRNPGGILGGLADWIDRELRFLQLTWKGLDLDQLGSLANVRRAQLQAAGGERQRQETSAEQLYELGASLAAETAYESHLGLLANAILAASAGGSRQTAANFLCYGVELGRRVGLGSNLLTSLCFMALRAAHSFPVRLDEFLRYLLQPQPRAGRPRTNLRSLLNQFPDGYLPEATLCLTNVAGKTEDIGVADVVVDELRNRMSRVPAGPDTDRTNEEIELFSLETSMRAKTAAPMAEVVNAWRSRSDHAYAWALYLLLREDPAALDQLLGEAKGVLDRQEGRVQYTHFIHLAARLGRALYRRSNGDRLTPPAAAALQRSVAFLRDNMPFVEQLVDADENRRIYEFLYAADPSRRVWYDKRIERWTEELLKQEGQRKLPSLVEQRRFFRLLWQYYDKLSFWGLATDVAEAVMVDYMTADAKERERFIREWRQRDGGEAPEPFRKKGGTLVLSSSFLRCGLYLFAPPLEADASLEEARSQVNEKAQAAMDTLYQVVINLPSLPDTIRAVIELHRQALTEYAVPA
jgi:hypothetical protein